jgi:hypothetical protein
MPAFRATESAASADLLRGIDHANETTQCSWRSPIVMLLGGLETQA